VLEEDLDHVRDDLKDAEGADPVRPVAVLEEAKQPPLDPNTIRMPKTFARPRASSVMARGPRRQRHLPLFPDAAVLLRPRSARPHSIRGAWTVACSCIMPAFRSCGAGVVEGERAVKNAAGDLAA
jgi:hypothetical protein